MAVSSEEKIGSGEAVEASRLAGVATGGGGEGGFVEEDADGEGG